jgi:hypothetical protein
MKPKIVDGKYSFQDYLKQCNPDIESNADNLPISAIWHLTVLDIDKPIDEDCVICQTYRRGSQHIICFKFINRPGGIFIDERMLLDGAAELRQVRKPLSAYADLIPC